MKVRHLLVLICVGALSACQRAPQDPVARGEAYFSGLGCVKCHVMGQKGTDWGPDLTTIGFRKSAQWLDTWLKDPHAWRAKTVMPSFNLKDDVRADLVAFLSAQKGQAWAATGRPWNHPNVKENSLKRGEILFSKAGCVACHSYEGRGGYPNNNVVGGEIPPLTKVFEGYTKEELKARIRGGVVPSPADPSQPAPMIVMPKWGDLLDDSEIDAVADYLISLGGKAGAAKGSDW